MYEFFEHTADLGLRARASDLNMLFRDAASALFAAIVDDLATVRQVKEIAVEVNGSDLEYLLFDWLRELLYRFDAEHMLFTKFEVTVTEAGLNGTASGEPIDPVRHVLSHEVKAITYHELKVKKVGAEWIAEVIVDI